MTPETDMPKLIIHDDQNQEVVNIWFPADIESHVAAMLVMEAIFGKQQPAPRKKRSDAGKKRSQFIPTAYV